MKDINSVTIVGRLTRDAESKYTNTGLAVAKFTIASNYSKKENENWVDKANFFSVTIMGKLAEAIGKYLIKGKQVGIWGELRHNVWTSNGENKSSVSIVANHVQLLGGDKSDNNSNNNRYNQDVNKYANTGNGGNNSVDNFEDDIPF